MQPLLNLSNPDRKLPTADRVMKNQNKKGDWKEKRTEQRSMELFRCQQFFFCSDEENEKNRQLYERFCVKKEKGKKDDDIGLPTFLSIENNEIGTLDFVISAAIGPFVRPMKNFVPVIN